MAKGTVFVNLRRDWESPDRTLYEARHNPHEFPAEWAEPRKKEKDEKEEPRSKYAVLPSSAEIVDGKAKVVEGYRLSANNTPIPVAEVVEGDVKSVGNTIDDTTKSAFDHNKTHQSTPISKAVAAAEESGAQVGGKPRESNPVGGKR